ncbi:MAG: 2-C-methyl-D-erythritol 2,4-cyclodiphosphate synthase [Deltaproteobacteria bacterium RIFCSPHIGHO2_12_FULL_43_9]|nr:MAG: 2-C-methyl-D-erythritol 2,4-cyclodiphosphate synthase [Deltaproteobacteria bacterium RIFCSPHIGHO2_12_FULL_43_9]
MRIGIGYDVHPLASGRKLFIGGVEVQSTLGSVGHSDGDVLIHALCDALLGAAGLGDIGKYFPSNDNSFKDIRSTLLLEKVVDNLKRHNYIVHNIDAIIFLEKPKVSSYTDSMRRVISDIVGIGVQMVSVKATTTDGLGMIGRGEGIAAQAIVTIRKSQ